MSFVVALFDYGEGASFGTPFSEGDVFRLIEKTNEQWWKVERKDKKIMYVPKQFVEVRDISQLPLSPVERRKERETSPSSKLMRSPTALAMTASSGVGGSVRKSSTGEESPSLPPRRYTVSVGESSPSKASNNEASLGVDDSLEMLHKRVIDCNQKKELKLSLPVCKKNVALPGGKKHSNRNWLQLHCVVIDNHLLFYKDRKHFEKGKSSGSVRRKSGESKDFPTSDFILESSYLQKIGDHKRKNVIELMNEKSGVIWCQLETQANFDEFKKVILSSGSKEVNGDGSIDEECDDEDDKGAVRKKLMAFFSRRPTMESLQGIIKEQYFAVHLHRLCEREKTNIPNFITSIILAIEERGLDTVGIYRLSGNAAQVQKIRFKVDQEEAIDYSDRNTWDDINVLTGALKLFLRELPEPLVPFADLDNFVAAIQANTDAERLAMMGPLIKGLPVQNYETMKYLLEHLTRVTALGTTNKMQSQNVAIVFGPTLMRKDIESINLAMEMVFRTSIVEFMLREYHNLFC